MSQRQPWRNTSLESSLLETLNTVSELNEASKHLRQELQELEILNEITKRQYEGTFKLSLYSETRAQFLREFTEHNSLFRPTDVHSEIS